MNNTEFETYIQSTKYIESNSETQHFMRESAKAARRITCEINGRYNDDDEIRKLFSELTGREADENFTLFPPFYTDYGKNIRVGKNVFINSCCCFQDQGGIEIGDGAFIGHQVVIATLNHNTDYDKRGDMIPSTVKIGRNVWIGSKSVILPGVSIGDGAVIGAGAVVIGDVPPYSVAVGTPAKVIKYIK